MIIYFRNKRYLPIVFLIIASVNAILLTPKTYAGTDRLEARIMAVNDGDTVTIRINGKRYRARLIGLDAPEMGQEPWGPKARAYLRKMLKDMHWRVSVETDIERYDKYDRLLVYLWSNDILINEQILSDGYGVLFTIQPNSKYADRFIKAQRIAREKKVGIWGVDGLKERPYEYKKKHPRESRPRSPGSNSG